MPTNRLFCPYCGSINREEAKFCLRCGRRLRTLCNVCGHSNGIDVSFCLQCGTRLANQKPIDQVIGYFVNKSDWQNTLVTTGNMGPFPPIRYIWAEMVRMGLCPLFIQWEKSESSIEELLVHIATSLETVDKRPKISLHEIIDKIKGRLLPIAPYEALSLINERLKDLEQPIALLIYLPSCPISYSAWKFIQDYFLLIKRLALPVFTITASPLTPVYAGFFAENKDSFSVQRWLQERYSTHQLFPHALTLFSANKIRRVAPGDTVELTERRVVCYPALEPRGYILASLVPNLSIQIRAQGTWNVNTDARKMGWKQITPAWGDLPEELFRKLLDNIPPGIGHELQVATFYMYQTESREENIWSHIAFIPPDTIARLQAPGVLEEDFILIY